MLLIIYYNHVHSRDRIIVDKYFQVSISIGDVSYFFKFHFAFHFNAD